MKKKIFHNNKYYSCDVFIGSVISEYHFRLTNNKDEVRKAMEANGFSVYGIEDGPKKFAVLVINNN